MKKRIIPAFVLLLTGIVSIADWMLFCSRPENKSIGFETLKIKYTAHLPAFLALLYHPPIIITSICFLLFVVAGILFIKEKKKVFKALGILSFILAFWELFSLM